MLRTRTVLYHFVNLTVFCQRCCENRLNQLQQLTDIIIIVALINLHCCKAIPQCGEKGIEGRKETFCATFEFGVIMIVVIVFVGVVGLDEIVGLLASVLCCWVITLHCRTDVEILEYVWTSR
jgi:hypothetical protein